MGRTSRRALLATLASGALGGCSAIGSPDTETVTAYDVSVPRTVAGGATEDIPEYGLEGPELLGDRAVPPGSDRAPSLAREQIYTDPRRREPVGVATRESGLESVFRVTESSSLVDPHRVLTDDVGWITDRSVLSSLPTPDVRWFARAGDRTLVGGRHDFEGSWMVDADADQVGYETETARLRSAAPLGDDIVVAGDTDPSGGVLRRVGADGTERWRVTVTDGTDLQTVVTAGGTAFAYGIREAGGWLVAFDGDGTERFQRTVPTGEHTYVPVDLAAGATGVYVLARGYGAFGDRPYLLLARVGADGEVRWQRVLSDDASYGETMFSGAVVDRGGPIVAGGPRLWRSAFAPDGSVRWAGYDTDDESVRRSPDGGTVVGDRTLLYGTYDDDARETSDPWFAFF